MKLARLAEAAGMDAGDFGDAQVTGFAIDHRKVAPGTVFGAFQGTVVNGEDFIPAIADLSGVRAACSMPSSFSTDPPASSPTTPCGPLAWIVHFST